jgi:diguanylate cyclase (GGDEF)-like protein
MLRSAEADRDRFLGLYVFLVAGLVAAAALFIYEARLIVEDNANDEEAFAVLLAGNQVLHDLENAETGQRGYLLTGGSAYLEPYRQGVDDLDDTMSKLRQAVAADPDSVDLVRKVERAKSEKVMELARTIGLAQSGNREAALAFVRTDEGKGIMDALRRDLELLLDRWRYRRSLATRDAHTRVIFESAALAAIAALVCGLIGYAAFVQRRAFASARDASILLTEQATHDALTDLPNRRHLLNALDALTIECAQEGVRATLLYLDIDGFKPVNDTLGHAAGDALLCELARALRATIDEDDLLARVGGDEFVVLTRRNANDAQLRALAQRLIACVSATGEREYGGRFAIGVSIGITTIPDRASTGLELLDVADSAMYRAKRAGRSQYAFGAAPDKPFSNVVSLVR